MASFTFTVDRRHQAIKGLSLHADLACAGATVAIAEGDVLVYRGTVDLDHKVRHVFDRDGQKLYTFDRAQLEKGLVEQMDELLVINP